MTKTATPKDEHLREHEIRNNAFAYMRRSNQAVTPEAATQNAIKSLACFLADIAESLRDIRDMLKKEPNQ